MDLGQQADRRLCDRLLRARGDGPCVHAGGAADGQAPPRPRRWTRAGGRHRGLGIGSSAPAEMDLSRRAGRRSRAGLLRARGDGPSKLRSARSQNSAPPRPRRWTFIGWTGRARSSGSSAPAEMDPASRRRASSTSRLLRARGDGPASPVSVSTPTSAPPRPRRWTLLPSSEYSTLAGSSAPAEMDPSSPNAASTRRGILRARGDGPEHRVPAASRGRLLRARGDGPSPRGAVPMTGRAPPRPRRWTRPGPG